MKVWLPGLLAILVAHRIWLTRNCLPPIWDMAHHQIMGWRYLEAFRDGSFVTSLPEITNYYPPLYYLWEMVVLSLGTGQSLPLYANLPGLVLLSVCTYCLARRWQTPGNAACAAWLALMFPLVAWTSRETLLDVTLSGLVALGFLILIRSDYLQSRFTVLSFGLVAACGLLTKWTFLFFMVGPVIYLWWFSPDRRRAFLNLLDAGLIVLPLTMWWYLPNLQFLTERFQATSQAAVLEADPSLFSLSGLVYYLRSLVSYYLFLPLSIALLLSLIWWARPARRITVPETGILWVFLGTSVLILTALRAKDPRYIMPVVSVLAVILTQPGTQSRIWSSVVIFVAALQFLYISFPLPGDPGKIALFSLEDDTDYRGMAREWVLYESDYFGVTGHPRCEDWKFDLIVAELRTGDRVGWAPELPYFHPGALHLLGVQSGKRLEALRVGDEPVGKEQLASFDWIVGKSGNQGISYITTYNREVYRLIEESEWPLIANWELPDGSQARLWRNPFRSP